MRCRWIMLGIIGVTFVVFLTACGQTEEVTVDSNEMVYEVQHIVPQGVNDKVSSFAVKNGRIYMYTTPLESFSYDEDGNAFVEDTVELGTLYSMDFDGGAVKKLPIPKIDGNIENIQLASNADIIQMLIKYERMQRKGYVIVTIDDVGEVQQSIDITEELGLQEAESVDKLLVSGKDQYVVVTDRRMVAFDMKGKILWEYIPQSGYMQSVACSKDGDILCTNVTEDGIQIDVVEGADGKKKNEVTIGEHIPMNGNLLIDGVDYDFYYRADSGIYGYRIKEKKIQKVLDYAASGIYAENVDSIIPVSATQMLGIADVRAVDGSKMVLYTKVDPADVQEKTTLTYAAVQIDSRVKDAIVDFNHSSSKYRVQVKEYYMEKDPEQAFALDLVSDNTSDIIDMTGMPLDQYVEKGVLENLKPYYEKDTDLGIEDIIPSVAQAMWMNEGYYYVSPGFRIVSLAGKASLLGEEPGWTIDDMISFAKQHPDSQLIYNKDRKELFAIMFEENENCFVDWYTGICSFDSGEFRRLLTFCKSYGVKRQEDVASGEELDMIRKDKIILTQVNIGAESMQVYSNIYGEDVTYKGYPSVENEGTYYDFSSTIGMSATSKNKEGAWEFLRSLMTEQYQTMNLDVVMGGAEDVVPTRQDAFELYKKSRMIVKPYTDPFNRVIEPLNTAIGYDSLEIPLKPLSEEQMNDFVQLVERTTSTRNVDIELERLAEEEAEAYFSGQQSLDKTIEVIQDRATKYVNENR